MKKITSADIKNIEVGTELFDTIDNKWVSVTRIVGQFFEIGYLIETADTIKKNYKLA